MYDARERKAARLRDELWAAEVQALAGMKPGPVAKRTCTMKATSLRRVEREKEWLSALLAECNR